MILDRVLEVHRDPEPDAASPYCWRYRCVEVLVAGTAIAPLALPSVPIAVAALLP